MNRPLVYVSRITNLSDARYCAGMGVDMLGFLVDPSDPDYVSPDAYRQLVGWISGPARVIETGSAIGDLENIKATYAPEYLHVSWKQIAGVPEGSLNLIVEIPFDELSNVGPALNQRKDIVHVLVTGVRDERVAAPSGVSILVASPLVASSVLEFIKASGAAGIALRGSREVVPGLKDYDHLSQVLEELNG